MPAPFDPPLEPEEVSSSLTQYTGFARIVQGGQGCVFKASSVGYSVAVKVYSPNYIILRAKREAEKLAKMSSPHIVKLLNHGYISVRNKECFYTVTKYENGQDLRTVLRDKGKLEVTRVRKLIKDMCSAIDTMWSFRVVHCDLKPENILAGSDGMYRVIDLGLAKHLDDATITGPGIIMGTGGYMAPEQLRGRKNLTIRVDLFALGIVTYEALTGRHPFDGNQLLIAAAQKPDSPAKLTAVPAELEKVILWMLEFNPLARPASGSEVVSKLGVV